MEDVFSNNIMIDILIQKVLHPSCIPLNLFQGNDEIKLDQKY